ncbi:ubiquitin carboxyl-terminal hydrolase 21-like isoform X1 [Triticum dicoccoides]|uniref:ubiquitin carboxyl-terminal hydrolase 21-like isoform X1 n=1 Tax=Triticum dicoccoides TaxID=85692 RepID=UPI000E7C6087|nr:ubiquitin carboxyl-terminal hydrolase 21-like isoform X1 [Triticum dicoccoides]
MAADDGEPTTVVSPTPHPEEEPTLSADVLFEPTALSLLPPPREEDKEGEDPEENPIVAPMLPSQLQVEKEEDEQLVPAAALPDPLESGPAPFKGHEETSQDKDPFQVPGPANEDKPCQDQNPFQVLGPAPANEIYEDGYPSHVYSGNPFGPSVPYTQTLLDSLNENLVRTRCCSRYKLIRAKNDFPMAASLSNPENWTCFLNCVLQCVVHLVPFVLKLLKHPHLGDCPSDEFCCYCFIRHHASEVIRHSGNVLYPRKFIKRLKLIFRGFKRGQHQDAHEFLRCLLDKLDMVTVTPSSKSKEPSSIVNEFFGGEQKSQLNCPNCGRFSDRLESFLDLNLEVNQMGNITDLLSAFTRIEVIEDYLCDGCKTRVNMEKCLKVERAPKVLVIQLKRFQNFGGDISKIDHMVNYPFELDLKPFMSCTDDEPHTYDLYGIVQHFGETARGHYVCYVRSSEIDWFLLNDDKVVKMSQDKLLQMEAYMLFYVKKGESSWFSTLHQNKEMLLSDYFGELAGKGLDEDGASKSGSYTSSESDNECIEQHDAGSHGGSSQENGRSCNLLQSSSHKNEDDYCCPENLTSHEEDEKMGLCDSPAGTSRIRLIGSNSDRIVNGNMFLKLSAQEKGW